LIRLLTNKILVGEEEVSVVVDAEFAGSNERLLHDGEMHQSEGKHIAKLGKLYGKLVG
jgi:hypothetical protein